MNSIKKYASVLTIFAMAGLLPVVSVGCAHNSGERAGARVDDAADDTADWAEEAADDVDDWADEAGDDIEDAVD